MHLWQVLTLSLKGKHCRISLAHCSALSAILTYFLVLESNLFLNGMKLMCPGMNGCSASGTLQAPCLMINDKTLIEIVEQGKALTTSNTTHLTPSCVWWVSSTQHNVRSVAVRVQFSMCTCSFLGSTPGCFGLRNRTSSRRDCSRDVRLHKGQAAESRLLKEENMAGGSEHHGSRSVLLAAQYKQGQHEGCRACRGTSMTSN